jgi:hypothetical protein
VVANASTTATANTHVIATANINELPLEEEIDRFARITPETNGGNKKDAVANVVAESKETEETPIINRSKKTTHLNTYNNSASNSNSESSSSVLSQNLELRKLEEELNRLEHPELFKPKPKPALSTTSGNTNNNANRPSRRIRSRSDDGAPSSRRAKGRKTRKLNRHGRNS